MRKHAFPALLIALPILLMGIAGLSSLSVDIAKSLMATSASATGGSAVRCAATFGAEHCTGARRPAKRFR